MTITDSHQPKTVGASTKPAVFVDGASGAHCGACGRLALMLGLSGAGAHRATAT